MDDRIRNLLLTVVTLLLPVILRAQTGTTRLVYFCDGEVQSYLDRESKTISAGPT